MSEPQLFCARLEKVAYDARLETCAERPYGFIYNIRLTNQGHEPLVVLRRKWIVTGCSGQVHIVEGDGVIGETPVIEGGGAFCYSSYLSIAEGSCVSGSYFGRFESGQDAIALLPQFEISINGH